MLYAGGMIRSIPTKYKKLSLIEFQRTFMNDEDCAEHLMEQRWGNDFVCQKCGNKKIGTLLREDSMSVVTVIYKQVLSQAQYFIRQECRS